MISTAVVVAVLAGQVQSVPELARQISTALLPSRSDATIVSQLDAMLWLVCGVVVWSLVVWLGLIVALGLLVGLLPGRRQRNALAYLRRLAPPALRGLIITAFGLGVVTGVSGCAPMTSVPTATEVSAAQAPVGAGSSADSMAGSSPFADITSGGGQTSFDIDWPVPDADSQASASADDPPPSPAPSPPRSPPPTELPPVSNTTDSVESSLTVAQSSVTVVVRQGDSLWSIASRSLGSGASSAAIDASWRAWYATNRDVIGSDPNQILPGWQLTSPPTIGVSRP